MSEIWALYDAERRPLGRVMRRGEPVPEGCYHLSVQVWIRDGAGRFLISRRHPDKPMFPLCWETPGGAAVAGEDSLAAALREVREELGIALSPEKGALLMSRRRREDFSDVWLFRWDGGLDALTLQPDEVVDARWADYGELCALEDAGEWVETLHYFRALFGGAPDAPAAILPMRPEDYDEVYALWHSTPGTGLNDVDDSREGIARFLARNPSTCFVARAAEGVVGAILAGHDGRRGHLYHAAVDPSMRGRGVGSALVRAALDALKEEGIAKAAIMVFADNESGMRFWLARDFCDRRDVRYMDVTLRPIVKFDPK